MKNFALISLFVLAVGCGSAKKEEKELEERKHENIQREYMVSDASSNSRPGWVEDAEIYARNHKNYNVEKYRYFSFETEPMKNRSIACDMAKGQMKADIAGEIATFIDKTLTATQEGEGKIDENNPNLQALKNYVSSSLTQKIQALVHGAEIFKTYWEKRRYKKELGAKSDFRAYICAVYIRVNKARLAKSVDEAANHVVAQAGDEKVKAKVKEVLKKASPDFVEGKTN